MSRASALCGAVAAVGLAFAALGEEPASSAEPELVLVRVHADWCLVCARLDTTFTKLERRLSGRAELLVLEVSDREALAMARELALAHDLASFFQAHRSSPGTAALLRRGTQEPLWLFRGELDPDVYVAAVTAATQAILTENAVTLTENAVTLPSVSTGPPEGPQGAPPGR